MVLGLPFFVLGIVLCVWAIGLFKRAHTSLIPVVPSAALVAEGPYRFTRNPMYLGLALIYSGTALFFQLSWGLLLLPLVLILVHFLVIVKEEHYLERRFGQVYRRYRLQVRRWL
jgi:protein-S-isoprenylcysteine O-methyltransferase Ste14